MIYLKYIYLFTIVISFSVSAQRYHPLYRFDMQSANAVFIAEFRYRAGDDSVWSEKDYKDFAWRRIVPADRAHPVQGIHWYRTYIKLTNTQKDLDLLTLQIHNLPSAYEVYWDGELIGKNGVIGNSKGEEIAGDIVRFFPLRRELTQGGTHLLAIRFSNYYQSGNRNLLMFFGYSEERFWGYSNFLQFQYFLMGIYLTAVILSFAVAFGRKKNYIYRLFAVYCLLLFIHISLSPLVEYFNLSMEHMVYIDILGTFVSRISYILIFTFLVLYLNYSRKLLHIGLFCLFMLIMTLLQSSGFLTRDLWIGIMMIQFISISFVGMRQKKPGSTILFIGYLVFCVPTILVIIGIPIQNYIMNATDIYLVFSIIILVRQQIRRQEKLINEAEIRSQRFEKELLKKYIQPHFLMNTLLSIISWIRQDPQKAVKLIQALAEEFRIINKISAEKEIKLGEEIQLCRAHLQLMGFRMDSEHKLNTHNIVSGDQIKIPPMIFHTLIENGLTHSFEIGENGNFDLFYESDNNDIYYTLQNSGSLLKNKSEIIEENTEDGMGFKYVKTRLEEAYPSRWDLTYGLENGLWKVNIRIKK